MFRSIGHVFLEIARAIDTGHAIRHGVTPRTHHSGRPTALSEADAAPMQRHAEFDALV